MNNREIAGYFGPGYTAVSQAARRNRQRSRKTEGYNTIVGKLEASSSKRLQIIGPRHRDDLALQASRAYEQMRPWNHNWPSTP